MPTVFLSHGAPLLADDSLWTRQLAEWSAAMPRPEAILVVSAHWEQAPLTIGATTSVPLIYDFFGFARRYYEVEYPAPGAPELAEGVTGLLEGSGHPICQDARRGLDHGAYVPLMEMYPRADIPVLQMSMPTLDPQSLLDLGRRLAPLRDEGVLIVGSGFSTHNLAAVDMRRPSGDPAPNWSIEFDDWLARSLSAGEIDALIDFQRKAPAADIAIPARSTSHRCSWRSAQRWATWRAITPPSKGSGTDSRNARSSSTESCRLSTEGRGDASRHFSPSEG